MSVWPVSGSGLCRRPPRARVANSDTRSNNKSPLPTSGAGRGRDDQNAGRYLVAVAIGASSIGRQVMSGRIRAPTGV